MQRGLPVMASKRGKAKLTICLAVLLSVAGRSEGGKLKVGINVGAGIHGVRIDGDGRYGNTWKPTIGNSWEAGFWFDKPSSSGVTGMYAWCENWFGEATENTLGGSVAEGDSRGLALGAGLLLGGNANIRFIAGTGIEEIGSRLGSVQGRDYSTGPFFEAGLFLRKSFFYARPIMHMAFPGTFFTGHKQVFRYGILLGLTFGDS
jgi:hypothetical protein